MDQYESFLDTIGLGSMDGSDVLTSNGSLSRAYRSPPCTLTLIINIVIYISQFEHLPVGFSFSSANALHWHIKKLKLFLAICSHALLTAIVFFWLQIFRNLEGSLLPTKVNPLTMTMLWYSGLTSTPEMFRTIWHFPYKKYIWIRKFHAFHISGVMT